jgi:hypothetical protein
LFETIPWHVILENSMPLFETISSRAWSSNITCHGIVSNNGMKFSNMTCHGIVSSKDTEFSNITCHGIVSNKGMEFQYHMSWYFFKQGHG